MKDETRVIGECAVKRLKVLLAKAETDSAEIIETKDIPATVAHFAELRTLVRTLQDLVGGLEEPTGLQKHVNLLSYEIIPTMFTNQNVLKTPLNLVGVGRVSIGHRWFGSLVNKEAGLKWLRSTGNEGLIIETVNAQSLGSWAKAEAEDKRPVPSDIFNVRSTSYVSITRG